MTKEFSEENFRKIFPFFVCIDKNLKIVSAGPSMQKMIGSIQGTQQAWFCGAWAGYGFHEDGLKSALRVARDFGMTPPWDAVYD